MGHTDYERTSGEWNWSVAAGSEGGKRKAGHPPPKSSGSSCCPSFSLMQQAFAWVAWVAWVGVFLPRGTSPFCTSACDIHRCGNCGSAQGRKESSCGFLTAVPTLCS